jgi:hypothetical protein
MQESMSINQKNIRAKGNMRLRELLIENFTTGTSSQSRSITRSSKGTRPTS